jgi:hypothetical protein
MKLTKQNKLYLGIAALGVVGYLIWKQTQTKKQEFLGFGKRRPKQVKTKPYGYFIVMQRYPMCDYFDCQRGQLGDFQQYFEKGDIVYGELTINNKNGRPHLQQPYTLNKIFKQPEGGYGMNIDAGIEKMALIPISILKPTNKPAKLPIYVMNVRD